MFMTLILLLEKMQGCALDVHGMIEYVFYLLSFTA